MLGKMQDWDLLVTNVIDHAAREAPTREIVTHWADGSETRTDWTGIRRDARRRWKRSASRRVTGSPASR